MTSCFLGSGTTAAVARKLARRFIGIEIDEDFACLAARRVELADAEPATIKAILFPPPDCFRNRWVSSQ